MLILCCWFLLPAVCCKTSSGIVFPEQTENCGSNRVPLQVKQKRRSVVAFLLLVVIFPSFFSRGYAFLSCQDSTLFLLERFYALFLSERFYVLFFIRKILCSFFLQSFYVTMILCSLFLRSFYALFSYKVSMLFFLTKFLCSSFY